VRRINVLAIVCIFSFCLFGFTNEDWEQVNGIQEADMWHISVSSFDNIIYVSSEKTLYRSEDGGNSWIAVFSVQEGDNEINFIGIAEQGVFICAKNGLFKSSDTGLNWKRVFKGVGERENNILHIAFSKDKSIFLGTKGGLFISRDNCLTWEKDLGEAGNLDIRWIEFMHESILIAAEKGVYKGSGSKWKRTFVTLSHDNEYDPDIADELIQAVKPVNCITINNDAMLLATDSGIFASQDNGDTWARFYQEGLLSLRIKRLLFNKALYAVTDKGIFIFSDKDKLWHNLYKGMNTKETRDMVVDKEGNILAVTNKGLYRAKQNIAANDISNNNLENEMQDILKGFKGEPSISDVQKAAIKYAEVHPDKIKEWRESAKKKALLPNVAIGLDRYVTDLLHWDSGTNPDTFQKGKDAVSWDITMTWNMGELIWNDDQTSIDTRSKLMVELRDDIMNEITRTYFERRRLQIEMLASPPQDLKLSLEKELRLQELTADIDALTGGYFSKSLEK